MCEMESGMAVYGYARVSTDGQSLTAQLAELKAAKCEKIFQEKISGARSDRKQLAKLMALLAKDDVLVVTRLDRLARSTRDLLNLLGSIGEKRAGFKSLRDAWADTTTAHGRLMLTVLGGLAEFERELIRTRTGEGRERAKARGGDPRSQAQTDPPSTARGRCSPGGWRGANGYCALIQREPQHY